MNVVVGEKVEKEMVFKNSNYSKYDCSANKIFHVLKVSGCVMEP